MSTARAAHPIIPPQQSYADVTDQLAGIPLHFPTRRSWLIALFGSSLLLGLLFVSAIVLFGEGVGIWGLNIPVNWAFAIHNYVWWLGIGHAGTLISALLLLLGREWRNSLNRFAETMTLFAVMCAGIYPILHLGGRGSSTGCFPIQRRCSSGRNFVRRSSGTSGRCSLI